MAEDMRELLHEGAPRPTREPDFEHLWARGRRQRRMTRLAGATGAVVLLALTGVGLTQLSTSGPGDVHVVEQPDTDDQLRGRGQDFGQAETPNGVPYVGRIRVSETVDSSDDAGRDRDEVCVSMRVGPQGGRSTAEGCGPLERHLTDDQMVWTHSRTPSHAAVVAWSPLEAERAVWELPDGELPVDVLEAPDLPGSVFVVAVDTAPQADTTIVLYDADGEQVDQLELTSGRSFEEEDVAGPDGEAVPVSDRWVTPDDREDAQDELGESIWIVGYFYPTDADRAGPDFSDELEPRWLRIRDGAQDLDRQAELRQALAALAGPPPTHMADTWQDPDLHLELATANLDGSELVLDFERLHAPAAGSTHAMAMRAQFEQTAFHYYPEADTICVLNNGTPAIWLHDMEGCPSRDRPQ